MAVASSERMSRRAIVSGAIGSTMEWYDFGLYAFFAPVLARLFFPTTDKLAGVLATFAAFAAGFLMRPVGALLFGHYGDRIGRKRALAASVILMAIPTFFTGLLPTHAAIGALAPTLLVLMRLLQGLSAGGESAGASSFLVEHAPPGHRGFIASFSGGTAVVGFLIGSAMGTLLTSVLSQPDLDAWGWRIAFLLGICVGAIGLFVRLKTPETPQFEAVRRAGAIAKSPILETVRGSAGLLLRGTGIMALFGAAFYLLLSYTPTYLSTIAGLPFSEALQINTIALLVLAVLVPPFGALSDVVGRKPLLIGSAAGFILLAYPLFAIEARGIAAAALGAQILLAVLLGAYIAPAMATVAEIFPTRVRYTGDSVALNVAFAVFGGTAPLAATFLIKQTGDRVSPAFMLIATGALSLIATLLTRETFRETLE